MKYRVGALPRVVLSWLLAGTFLCSAQQPAAKPVPARAAKAAPVKPKTAKPNAEVLTNETVISMAAARLEDSVIVAKIASTPAKFDLATDRIIELKSHGVSSQVLKAMLNKAAAVPAPPEAATTAAAVLREVKDPGPALPVAPAVPAIDTTRLEAVTVRDGAAVATLSDKPMKVMFVKSDATSAKAAIANLLLSDVGMNLITMGLSSQMMAWNPYSAELLSRAGELGRGMLTGKGSETKGFEYEMLSGVRSDRELKAGKAEFFIPASRYVAPDTEPDWTAVQPVILRLDVRASDQARLMSGRQVTVKRVRKGRLDFKPESEREAAALEQSAVPAEVERAANNVFVVRPSEPLGPGEYALVLRRRSPNGQPTDNVPLKGAEPAANPGMRPEQQQMMAAYMGQTTPEQQAQMAQAMAAQQQSQQQSRSRMGGMFGRRAAAPPGAPQPHGGTMTQFIAWDFRVVE